MAQTVTAEEMSQMRAELMGEFNRQLATVQVQLDDSAAVIARQAVVITEANTAITAMQTQLDDSAAALTRQLEAAAHQAEELADLQERTDRKNSGDKKKTYNKNLGKGCVPDKFSTGKAEFEVPRRPPRHLGKPQLPACVQDHGVG